MRISSIAFAAFPRAAVFATLFGCSTNNGKSADSDPTTGTVTVSVGEGTGSATRRVSGKRSSYASQLSFCLKSG